MNTNTNTNIIHHCSKRAFAKRGIPRGRRKRRREDKPGRPRKRNKPAIDVSRTRYLTATPWGVPRYPVPRVEETSVEFAQNLNSLACIVKGMMCCQNLAVSQFNHASKAALERLHDFAHIIIQNVEFIHLYQFVIVEDILSYSRDMSSRNTIWIPTDFTIKELIQYLTEECISDPKLIPLKRLDNYMNPFQANNWRSINNLSALDGSLSRSRVFRTPMNDYRELEPIELHKIREKARHTVLGGERYTDSNSFFQYWDVPHESHKPAPQKNDDDDVVDGTSHEIPRKYAVTEEAANMDIDIAGMDDSIEENAASVSDFEQLDEVEKQMNARLLAKKQWFVDALRETNPSDSEFSHLMETEFDDQKSMDNYYLNLSETRKIQLKTKGQPRIKK